MESVICMYKIKMFRPSVYVISSVALFTWAFWAVREYRSLEATVDKPMNINVKNPRNRTYLEHSCKKYRTTWIHDCWQLNAASKGRRGEERWGGSDAAGRYYGSRFWNLQVVPLQAYKHVEEWNYTYMNWRSWQWMEMNGQFCAPAASSPRQIPW
jgi:hypothetical protein